MRTCRMSILAVPLAIVSVVASQGSALATEKAWLSSADEAFAQAEARDQPILVDLFADWCLACRALQQEVFPTDTFQQQVKDMILLRVDVMDQGEGTNLMARYGVQKLPNTLMLSPDGVRLASVQGYMDAEQLVAELDMRVERYENLKSSVPKVVAAKDQPELQERVARDFHERMDGSSAVPIYESLLAGDNLATEDRGRLLYFLADAYRLAGHYSRAAKLGEQARSVISETDPDLVARVDLLAYYIARNSGDCTKAEALLEGFIETHRDSGYARDARRFLRDLRRGERNGCRDTATASM